MIVLCRTEIILSISLYTHFQLFSFYLFFCLIIHTLFPLSFVCSQWSVAVIYQGCRCKWCGMPTWPSKQCCHTATTAFPLLLLWKAALVSVHGGREETLQLRWWHQPPSGDAPGPDVLSERCWPSPPGSAGLKSGSDLSWGTLLLRLHH